MNRTKIVVIVAIALAAFAPVAQATSCPKGDVDSVSRRVEPGGTIQFRGENWFRCEVDSGGCAGGTDVKDRDVDALLINAAGELHQLGQVSPNKDGVVRGTLTLPADIRPGEYGFVLEQGYQSEPLPVMVVSDQ